MRECAYVRVSTDLLEQDSSYNNQEQMYLDRGITHIYKDRESGTSINNRQGFISMLEDCGLEVKAIKTSNKNTKQIVVNDLEANIVKSIFDLRLTGRGARVIAKELNKQGCRTKNGKPFSANTVLNILQNMTYCGYSRRNVFFSEGFGDMCKRVKRPKSEHILVKNKNIPIIISEEDFNQVQELIQLSKHQYKNIGKNTSKNPLVGKVKCEICGKNYIKVNSYYKCITKHKGGRKKCSNKDILVEDLDKVINHHVKVFKDKATINLNVINITLDNCISVANSKRGIDTIDILKRNTEAIRGHRERIDKLLDMLLDDNASSNDVIREKIDIINKEIAKIERDNEILQSGESYIADFTARCEKVRDKITTYINSLPSGVDKERYIKDYLVSIKVGNELSVEDKTVKHTKEVLSLYGEITDSTCVK